MDKNSTGTFTETAAVYRSSLIYILNVSKSKTNSKHHWQNKLGKQWKRFSASKKKTVNETLRMFTKCSTRKNNWEKSYKSAKSSYNFCSFADHSGYCRKRNQLVKKIYSRHLQKNYFRKFFGKMQLQEFQIF